METTRDVMTVDEVAGFMRVSRETVYRLALRGELPGRKIGRVWRFRKDAIHKYMEGESAGGQASTVMSDTDAASPAGGEARQNHLISAGASEP